MRKIVVRGLVGVCMASVVAADDVKPKWISVAPKAQAYLSITFDDATASQFTTAYPIMEQAGLTGTLYVNTGMLDAKDSYFMSWDNVRTLQQAKWEIGAHTVTHTALPTLDDISVVGELVLSRDRIAAEIGMTPVSFASPYGEYDDRTMAHIGRYFDLHLRAWGSQEGVDTRTVEPLHIERINIDETLTVDQVCSMVAAVEKGRWLILMFHQVRELRTPDEHFVTTPQSFAKIASCISREVNNQNLTVGTVSAVFNQVKKE